MLWQLGEYREARAIPLLERVLGFDREATSGGPFHRTRESLVEVAREAIEKIEEGGRACE